MRSLKLALWIVSDAFRRFLADDGWAIASHIALSSLMAMFQGIAHNDPASMVRGQIGLAGASPHYRCYECADGRHVAVGALEPQFQAELLAVLE